jgi:2-phosphoglycerate kinase
MKLRFQEGEGPYPLAVLRGRLRLSGLSDQETSNIIDNSLSVPSIQNSLTEDELVIFIDSLLEKYPERIRDNFRLLTDYEQTRGDSRSTNSLILILEGASATGKSMLALELVQDLAATRFISTDTIRQIIRGIYDEQSHPELYCHTYQAYKHKQSGNISLDPIVRGYIAQSELIMKHLQDLVKRVHEEGAIAVFEGVHFLPGIVKGIDANILEIVINPSRNTHKIMFLSKNRIGKLKTVSQNLSIRTQEFEDTRKIQDYLISCAMSHEIPVINMESYEEARREISNLIVDTVREHLKRSQ